MNTKAILHYWTPMQLSPIAEACSKNKSTVCHGYSGKFTILCEVTHDDDKFRQVAGDCVNWLVGTLIAKDEKTGVWYKFVRFDGEHPGDKYRSFGAFIQMDAPTCGDNQVVGNHESFAFANKNEPFKVMPTVIDEAVHNRDTLSMFFSTDYNNAYAMREDLKSISENCHPGVW